LTAGLAQKTEDDLNRVMKDYEAKIQQLYALQDASHVQFGAELEAKATQIRELEEELARCKAQLETMRKELNSTPAIPTSIG
jgi:predicted RNase H-like nuclease (RuvC/YqgF family)